jgi:AcrR family transcriptional regulator
VTSGTARYPAAAMAARTVDETYDALRRAAGHLLATEGPSALTVRRIATEAGVSTMNVYSRFGGKDGIVDELFIEGFERLAEGMDRVRSTKDPLADLRRCGEAYRRFALEHPTAYSVMFDGVVPDHHPSERAQEVALGTLGLLVERVQRVVDAGQFVGDAEQIAVVIWAANHGVVSLERKQGPPGIDWPAVHRAALSALARGYAPAG